MDSKDNIILIIFFIISIIIWNNWQNTNNYIKNNTKNMHFKVLSIKNRKFFHTIKKKNNIVVKTDKFLLYINPYGGNIEKLQLVDYLDRLNSQKFFTFLNKNNNFIYQAKSEIVKKNNLGQTEYNSKNFNFFSKSHFYQLKKNQNILKIPLFFLKNNILYIKIFTFERGSYAININHKIFNNTNQQIYINILGQIKKSIYIPKKYLTKKHNNFAIKSFYGIAFSTEQNKYTKYKFDKIIQNKNIKVRTLGGWLAISQQYFATAWILTHLLGTNTIYTKKIDENIASINFKSSDEIILSNSQKSFLSTLWVGPKISEQMSKVAPFLNLTIDYGLLWFLSQPLFKLLNLIYNIIGNWGYSIIFITFLVKMMTYPLSKQQYISMIKMRFLQPQIKKIKENFGHDKQRFSKEIISLYKRENINPLSGLFPIIIQMPIFLSLYYMLTNSVELRHAPFIFWIKDLSSEDPYYILPIIMGITMFFIQKTSQSNSKDNKQMKIMYLIPFIFSLFFLWFPSGLVLYYIVSNIITLLQQKWISLQINKKKIKI
ncbi:membrane protein insertase YidC [Enterobacteriaceae endosymbiont of Donacia tomentosa]|uniref:membrane protein insertase YidC n=1 Tax=Enterobacteriaceae endosymbiont of Donacia tomentosa TaxID=2675787 RepID=UPI001449275A|nr:membrane protein insertase YidC [Enterobacteriaceae endosymbiont of Donacia tomentosa]QJC31846.1 membrane protein insertase YidC [Enterobacteriaceae endosymbiont of Donacia tomentosa]